MNKDRRKSIKSSIEAISNEVKNIELCIDEEQIAYDSLPEGIQMGERGEMMEQTISNLTDQCDTIKSAMDEIEDAIK